MRHEAPALSPAAIAAHSQKRSTTRPVSSFEASRVREVLDFWFGTGATHGTRRKEWFTKDATFDAQVTQRFENLWQRAAAGELDAWRDAPDGCLAYVIVTDQFPRNMFRDKAEAFATDARALSAAKHAIARKFDQACVPVEKMFLYLPFEHSERLADQRYALKLMASLMEFPETADAVQWAKKHYEVVARFGRFPHRNEPLGRSSTDDEIAFLAQPGSRF